MPTIPTNTPRNSAAEILQESAEIGETLAASRREDLSVVLVEQNIGFALSLADRVVVMENGTVVDRLSATESQNRPERIERYLGIH